MLLAVAVMRAADVRVVVEVREWGTMSPVPGARVEVGARTVTADRAGRAVVDSNRGGAVLVSASAPEFMAVEEPQELPLPYDSPSMAVRVYLARKKTITGTLLDPSSERPLPGYQVRLLRETKYRGERMFAPMETYAVSGDDGRFELSGFMPASFALRISRDYVNVRATYDVEETLPERSGRFVAYWPGIRNEEPDRAITIAHGVEQELGKVYAAAAPLHAVLATVEGRPCSGHYEVSVYRRKELVRERVGYSQIGCERGFVVENLPEGEYVFEALRPGLDIATRSIYVTRNERIKLLARAGFYADIGFAVEKTGGQVFAKLAYPDAPRVELNRTRRFWMWPDEPYEFDVRGVAPGYFFESILVPGARVAAGDVVRLSGVTRASVQLVIAKPAALLAGKVVDGSGGPVSALVEAVREGAPRDRKRAMAGRDGKFSLRGLAPGRYRVFAADAEELAVFVEAKAGEPAWAEVRR